jgi:hypothetical protein
MDAKDIVDTVKSGAQYMKDKVMGTDAQNAKAAAEMKEQDARNPDSVQAKINKVVGYKKGGNMEFKHKMEHEKKHAAGHQHEQEKVAKHAAGHKMHHEHVKAMHKGGKC